MSWICPSCGLENSDDSLIRCVCGYELNKNSLQEIKVEKQINKNVSKKIHVLLILIGLGGLAAGYILVPIIALIIDIIMVLGIFVPIGKINKVKET